MKRIFTLAVLLLCTASFADLKSLLQEKQGKIDRCGDELIQLFGNTPNILNGQAEIVDANPESESEAFIEASIKLSINPKILDNLQNHALSWAAECYDAVVFDNRFQESFSKKIENLQSETSFTQITLKKPYYYYSNPSINIKGNAYVRYYIGNSIVQDFHFYQDIISISSSEEIRVTPATFEPLLISGTIDISDDMTEMLTIDQKPKTGKKSEETSTNHFRRNKNLLGERHEETDEGYAEGGSGGIGDGLAGLLGGGGGGIATKAKGSIRTPSEHDIDMGAGGGSRSKSEIQKVVKQRTPGLRHIYNKFLKRKPGFAGKIFLKFTIAPGGEIISISIASSTTGFGEFDKEIKAAVSRWKFGKIKSGNTTVTIPFTFSE